MSETNSENLPALYEQSESQLLEALGFKHTQFGNGLPLLKVNVDDEDENGNTIPRGQWSLYGEDGRVFGKKASFRPYYAAYQYSHFDSNTMQLISKSIFFQNFSDEVFDTVGTYKCGKLPRKQIKTLTDHEQELQRKIKLAHTFFGLASVEGTNPKGEKAKVVDVPCMLVCRGANYMPMTEFFESLNRVNIPPYSVVVELDLKREKNGGVTYWTYQPDVIKEGLKLTTPDFELIKKFIDTVAAENKDVFELWRKQNVSVKRGTKTITNGSTVDAALNDSVDDLVKGKSDVSPFT